MNENQFMPALQWPSVARGQAYEGLFKKKNDQWFEKKKTRRFHDLVNVTDNEHYIFEKNSYASQSHWGLRAMAVVWQTTFTNTKVDENILQLIGIAGHNQMGRFR